jgi:hypothetical protein
MSTKDTETTDEQVIPLLDDVVKPDEIEISEKAEEVSSQPIPDTQAIIEVLRMGVANQLIHELQPIVSVAVDTAVTEVTEQARQLLFDELNGSLEKHIRRLIEAAVEREFISKQRID